MNYYAHTTQDENSGRVPECQRQPLKGRLGSVDEMAQGFGHPLGIESEEKLAGLLNSPAWVRDRLSTELYARLLFSCLVDGHKLDTACSSQSSMPDRLLNPERLVEMILVKRNRKKTANPDSPLKILRSRIFR